MSIEVRNLTYTYSKGLPDEHTALSNVNFSVYDDEIAAIIGHTGSGKSTLVQQLNGLLKPDEGNIFVGGQDITQPGVVMRDIRKKVGLVFQYPEYQLFEETVRLDVAFGPKNLGLEQEEIERRVDEALRLVGLDPEEIGERSPFDLSGGQRRRVAIAGVIAMKPEVLILDEPTAGLDPGAHRDIIQMIREIHENEHNIIIFVSHNMGDVAELADKVMVIERGKVIAMGSPREIFLQPARLSAIGLNVPPATELVRKIRERGVEIDTNVLNVDEAEEALYRVLMEKQSRK
ncbi:MAG: energy-coupling factor transporter ATPase [Anaerovoracaceae bacterium]|jgi:energy-coupling factor transport system ATP-binding protein